MRNFRHSVLLLRHRLADVLVGPQSMALMPAAVILCFLFDANVAVLIASILVPIALVFAALADKKMRRHMSFVDVGSLDTAGKSFEMALSSALYRGRMTSSSVVCFIVEMNLIGMAKHGTRPADIGETNYQSALLIGSLLRSRDKVCVLGRNKFGVVIDPARDLQDIDAVALARRLKCDIELTQSTEALRDHRSVVIGIGLAPKEKAIQARDLVRAANEALRDARGSHAHGVKLLVPDPSKEQSRSDKLYQQLDSALSNGEFCGWFQPQVCSKTGRVTGFETLARWVHPDEGVIPPSDFLPILQKRGMLHILQERMLHEALDAFEAWRDLYTEPPSVGINLAQDDLLDPALPDRIMWELDRRKIEPRYLNVEVLETVISQSSKDITTRNIDRLADMGCRIDLDDFGTGHASISSLKQFTLHRLKIDRSFVEGIEQDAERENMVAAILIMAKQLGLDTLAEGVETPDAEARLARLGCGHLQGFGIARPMPLCDVLSWLTSNKQEEAVQHIPRSAAS